MANGNGFIKLHRKFLEWQWYSDENTKSVFIHCLLSANYQETKWKNEVIPIGAFITSAEKLGAEIGLSRQQVRRAFSNLQTTNEITIKSTNKYTIVYVQNWAKYQMEAVDVNQQKNKRDLPNSTNEQPTNNQQTTTDKEIKEIKKLRSEEKNLNALVGDCEKLATEWNELMKAKSIPQVRMPLSQTRKSHIENRIASHGIDVFREMMNKVAMSDFCNGSSNGWLASFDWCINPANFTKIIEGNYDNKKNSKPSITNGKPNVEIGWLDGYMKTIQ